MQVGMKYMDSYLSINVIQLFPISKLENQIKQTIAEQKENEQKSLKITT